MNDRKQPQDIIDAIRRDPRVRGCRVLGQALGLSEVTVQKWCLHPEDREVQGGSRSPLEVLEIFAQHLVSRGASDLALVLAGFVWDLAFDACLSRGFKTEAIQALDRLADRAGKVLVDELPEIKQASIAGIMKEAGEACVALCQAIDRECTNLEQIVETEQEVRELVEQAQTVYNRLQRVEEKLKEQRQGLRIV